MGYQLGVESFVNIRTPVIAHGSGFYISNFTKFDLYNADFGAGHPELVRFPIAPIPGMCMAYPAPHGSDICCVFSMYEEDSARLKALNCKTGHAVITGRVPAQHGLFKEGAEPLPLWDGLGRAGRRSRSGGPQGEAMRGDHLRGIAAIGRHACGEDFQGSRRPRDVLRGLRALGRVSRGSVSEEGYHCRDVARGLGVAVWSHQTSSKQGSCLRALSEVTAAEENEVVSHVLEEVKLDRLTRMEPPLDRTTPKESQLDHIPGPDHAWEPAQGDK